MTAREILNKHLNGALYPQAYEQVYAAMEEYANISPPKQNEQLLSVDFEAIIQKEIERLEATPNEERYIANRPDFIGAEIHRLHNAIDVIKELSAANLPSHHGYSEQDMRKCFEALDLAQMEIRAMYKRLGINGSNVLDKVDAAYESLNNQPPQTIKLNTE